MAGTAKKVRPQSDWHSSALGSRPAPYCTVLVPNLIKQPGDPLPALQHELCV